MILDAYGAFDINKAFTATGNSDVVDFSVDRNVGIGEELAILVQLTAQAEDGDSDETYSIAVQTDTVEAFTSPTTLHTFTVTRGAATGSRFIWTLPKDTSVERFLRLRYTLGGTTPSITLSGFLTLNKAIDAVVHYRSGFKISG